MKFIDTFTLPEGDLELKDHLNNNPWLLEYTRKQNLPDRNPNETDRGGWRGYNRVYSKYISSLKNETFNLLEIGVHSGYGLLAWLRYFKNSSVHGVEKSLDFIKLYNQHFVNFDEFCRAKINFFDSTVQGNWLKLKDKFDVIIDDGSHMPADQVRTFRNGWQYLKPGGYYFIEDISKRYYNPSCEEVFKELALCEVYGNEVTVYSHENKGWANILADESRWKQYGITKDTPKEAIDYIAVIHRKSE